MTWKRAHGPAVIAAEHAHADFKVAREGYVDVFAALRAGGIKVMVQPIGSLFGVYFAPDEDGPGVLVNSGLDETALRHTAAHELGHHCLAHGTTADESLEAFDEWGRKSWPEPEKQAEAFAAWFLMPRAAVNSGLAAMGCSQVAGSAEAYQLSLWLGTSYQGTLRHLANLRMIAPRDAEAWSTLTPGELRRELDGGRVRGSKRHWRLGAAACGRSLHVRAGDRFTITLDTPAEKGVLPTGVSPAPARSANAPFDGTHVLEVDDALTAPSAVSLGEWHATFIPAPSRLGYLNIRP